MVLSVQIECVYCREPIAENQEAINCWVCGELAHVECSAPREVAEATRLYPAVYEDICFRCQEFMPDWDGMAKEREVLASGR